MPLPVCWGGSIEVYFGDVGEMVAHLDADVKKRVERMRGIAKKAGLIK
jgi:hypothetical protein